MKCKHIIWGQGQLLHIHKAWCGKGAGCRRLPYASQGERKCFSKTPSELPAWSIMLMRSSDTQPWAWLQQCSAPGHSGGHEPWWDGTWRGGQWWPGFSATLDISWSSRTTESQKPSHEIRSSGRCQRWVWMEVCESHQALWSWKHLLSKQRMPHSKEHLQSAFVKLMTAWFMFTKY